MLLGDFLLDMMPFSWQVSTYTAAVNFKYHALNRGKMESKIESLEGSIEDSNFIIPRRARELQDKVMKGFSKITTSTLH